MKALQTVSPGQGKGAGHEPLFDVHPQTGAAIEVFYADRSLETFGRCGAGWFWWSRRRGYPAEGPATGPFATSYAAYRHATTTTGFFLETRSSPPRIAPPLPER